MKSPILTRLNKPLSSIPISTRLSWFMFGAFTCLVLASPAFAQSTTDSSPWGQAVNSIQTTLTGPVARGVSLVAIVAGGLGVAFGEGQMKKTIGGVVAGVGMAMAAPSFLSWISPGQ
jgi:type IV secretion system protein VirB2